MGVVDGNSITSLCMNNNSVADTAITEVVKQYQEYRWKDLNFYYVKNSDISKKNVNRNEKSNFKNSYQ